MEVIIAPFMVGVSVFIISIAVGRQYYWLSILAWMAALAPTCIAMAPFPLLFAVLIALAIFALTMTIVGPLIGIGALATVIFERIGISIAFLNETSGLLVVLLAAIAGNIAGFAIVDKRYQPQELAG